jgi:O-antigen ligase
MKRRKPKTPLPVLLLVLGIICPLELTVIIGTLHLPPHRCIILLFIGPALTKLFGQKRMKLKPYDILFVLYNCWTTFVFATHMELQAGLTYGGSLAAESLGGYAIARAYIRDYDAFMATLNTIFKCVVLEGLLALPEAFTGAHFVHTSLKFIGGVTPSTNSEIRWGLTRSYATFHHPILYGAFCASLLSLVWFTESTVAKRVPKAFAVFGATFLGLSSAPLNTLIMQSFLGGVHRGTKNLPNRVKMFAGVLAVAYVIVALFTDQSPLVYLATRITIDPETGYYRTLIWTFGMQNVWAHPWTGIGLDPWERPRWMPSDSVDSFWLLVMMQQGFPAIILLISAIWLLIKDVHKRGPGQRPLLEQRASVGWTLSFLAFGLAGITVHYWDATHTYLFLLLGMSGWLADPLKVKKKVKAKAAQPIKTAAEPEPEPEYDRWEPWREPVVLGHYPAVLRTQ